jgi:hypothetical protein
MEEWYNKYRKKLYSRHEFRKEKFKRFLILAFFIALIVLAYIYDFQGVKTKIQNINLTNINFASGETQKNGSSYISIKELSQNSSHYFGKKMNVSGMLDSRVGGDSLRDEEGYWIWIEPDCMESQKEYNYNSQFYTAEGRFLAPKQKDYPLDPMIGFEYLARFNCSSPLY